MSVVSDRASLFAYFRARHASDERMQETRFSFTGVENGHSATPFGGFEFTVTRQAADIPLTWVSGKGAVACTAPNRVAVWSQGTSTLPGMGILDPVRIEP